MALITPVTVGITPTLIIPAGTRVGYRITVKSGSDVAFCYGDSDGATQLTFAKGDAVSNGQTVVQTDERIAKYPVYGIVSTGSATVSGEIFH